MIAIRRGRAADAEGVGAATVAAWRSAYPGILPAAFLSAMSDRRQAALWRASLLDGDPRRATFVAVASGEDALFEDRQSPQVIGFCSCGRAGGGAADEGEIETLYIIDDYRDRGLGRRLMHAAAAHLAASGCRSVRLWVLRANPSRWFYLHLGGRLVAEQEISVGGQPVVQQAMRWDPIETLLAATAPRVGG